MDPPGFALESYDVIGGWRTNYRALANGGEKDAQGRRVRVALEPLGRSHQPR